MSDGADTGREHPFRWFARRAGRHLRWAHEQGLGRLIEEDQLDPVIRARLWLEKWRWRHRNDCSPHAVPVFVAGVQRSGTNMLVRGFETSAEFEVHNENDRRAFRRFRIKPPPAIRSIVVASRHRFVLFKPLCDSHRVHELLDELDTPSPGKAIWAYRSAEGRARSSVAKFGSNNLQVLREIAEGRAGHRWQAQRLSEESLALICSFDLDRMDPLSAAALFWFVRNSLYFELGLHNRPDVTLASYEAMVAEPERSMRALCSFLEVAYSPRLIADVAGGRTGGAPAELHPRVRRLCEDLVARLDEARGQKDREHVLSGGGPNEQRRAAP